MTVDIEEGAVLQQALRELRTSYYQLSLVSSFFTLGEDYKNRIMGSPKGQPNSPSQIEKKMEAIGKGIELLERRYQDHLRRQHEESEEYAQKVQLVDSARTQPEDPMAATTPTIPAPYTGGEI
jgi:hypothetical protein